METWSSFAAKTYYGLDTLWENFCSWFKRYIARPFCALEILLINFWLVVWIFFYFSAHIYIYIYVRNFIIPLDEVILFRFFFPLNHQAADEKTARSSSSYGRRNGRPTSCETSWSEGATAGMVIKIMGPWKEMEKGSHLLLKWRSGIYIYMYTYVYVYIYMCDYM